MHCAPHQQFKSPNNDNDNYWLDWNKLKRIKPLNCFTLNPVWSKESMFRNKMLSLRGRQHMNQDASSTIGKHLRELADNGCTVGLGRIRGPKMHRYFSDTQVRDNRCIVWCGERMIAITEVSCLLLWDWRKGGSIQRCVGNFFLKCKWENWRGKRHSNCRVVLEFENYMQQLFCGIFSCSGIYKLSNIQKKTRSTIRFLGFANKSKRERVRDDYAQKAVWKFSENWSIFVSIIVPKSTMGSEEENT